MRKLETKEMSYRHQYIVGRVRVLQFNSRIHRIPLLSNTRVTSSGVKILCSFVAVFQVSSQGSLLRDPLPSYRLFHPPLCMSSQPHYSYRGTSRSVVR
ncbi:hypothetical protein RRG08_031969 [Elysia crispata]|uniref:Uncharacterized protein n=1 Tax=Elysia crispata TaxID=231223 RepID=A0AAE0Z5N9_9GAST|nr:hypothetical protein RRG08_031969 [Elysia crispata]